MTARRLPTGGRIDRTRPLTFSFDGATVDAFKGDTIASALLAADVSTVGRSFKYHRSRGIWGAWVEEPNALVDVTLNGNHHPVTRATTQFVEPGLVATTVNGPRDPAAILDRFAKFIPAAFYYKTFMWPHWHVFEPRIRQMAGLGRVKGEFQPRADSAQINHHCDLLVVGAGPAGLQAARVASEAGKSVLLVDDQPEPGGSLLHHEFAIGGQSSGEWIAASVAAIGKAGGNILTGTTAYGIYDHHLVCLNQRHGGGKADTLWRVRPQRIIIAAGAIERPLVFENNDRPGVMSADAGLKYLRRHAVLPGETIVVATNNDSAYAVAHAMSATGAKVTVLDSRAKPSGDFTAGRHEVQFETPVTGIHGQNRVEGVEAAGRTVACDLVLVSGGWTPTVHLFCQATGKLQWHDATAAFLPREPLAGISVVGAANGTFDIDQLLVDAGIAATSGTQPQSGKGPGFNTEPVWHDPGRKGRAWVDYQNDVTIKDVELAARENFQSVEHLKRYTTLGMANDQGKTSNINGLAAMAAVTGRTIDAVGTTTYRPPFTPVPLASIGGWRAGELFNPVRRLPLENTHRGDGAVFREYGGWLRPAYYGAGDADSEIQREALRARRGVGLFDGSTLGKIEVMGPDAAGFLDFHYYNTVSTLKNGRIRYGFMLTEGGVVYDDGVVTRLSDNHFVVSCSSSHVDGVHRRLEKWRQDIFQPDRVHIHNATAQWATLTATGPNSRKLLERLDLGIDLDDSAMPHMSFRTGAFDGAAVRLSRVSFSGDRSYEIAVPADRARALWTRLNKEGKAFDANRIGLEAMSILRAEKGFIIIGKDTDGTTMPQDLGVTGPLLKKQGEYIGKRSLFTDAAKRDNRRQLVGLDAVDADEPLVTGAHGIERGRVKNRSIGYVTSSYHSPYLRRPIAMGLIERGASRMGDEIEILHLGKRRIARICPVCAFDPELERINA